MKTWEYLEFAKSHLFVLAEGMLPEPLFLVPYEADEGGDYFPSMRTAFSHSQFFSPVWIMNENEKGELAEGKKPSDETYAILMSRFYDSNKEFHQYFFVFKKMI
ncbi:MAG: hypothetical protein K6E13_09670 [Lachnospiraceae bacterium]|nr:hypothetical protein [Lachnospiraceae bacterium]